MFESDILKVVLVASASVVAPVLSYILKAFVDKKTANADNREINEEVTKITKIIEEGDKDVLTLMIKNVAELREYYVMNKQQARNAFSAALTISILGFFIFSAGIFSVYYMPEKSAAVPYSTIGGAIVEIIAGLFFWLYSKAIKQINIFHTSLQSTEKFLTAIQLVEKISPEMRDASYKDIIEKIISFNFAVNKEAKV
ncbi:hypothetical protein ACFQT0_13005 [Hymenobacter humi]|uniref:Cyanobacterial TRADD-N associated 2 transmembrane domain-containing protein n=1 Tax=Hymenobacter humi TaxID=1411620 RepID=A0ABW2U5P9_9BACT